MFSPREGLLVELEETSTLLRSRDWLTEEKVFRDMTPIRILFEFNKMLLDS